MRETVSASQTAFFAVESPGYNKNRHGNGKYKRNIHRQAGQGHVRDGLAGRVLVMRCVDAVEKSECCHKADPGSGIIRLLPVPWRHRAIKAL